MITLLGFDLELLARFVNGWITVFCGLFLLNVYIKWKRKNHFHFLWGLGFILYGTQILLRTKIYSLTDLPVFSLFFVSIIFWFAGVGFALGMLKKFLAIVIIVTMIVSVLILNVKDLLVLAFIPGFMLIGGIFLLRIKCGKIMNTLFLGWILLLIVNIPFVFGLLPQYLIDFLAASAKLIILYGATNPMFAMVGLQMEEFLRRRSEATPIERSHIALVKCVGDSRLKELSWIKQTVSESSKKGIKTILVILYDLISPLELRDLGILDDENVYLVRVLRDVKEETSFRRLMTIKDDLTSLGFLLSNIIKYSQESSVNCNVIFYSLSWLIHSHDWRSVFMLVTHKAPDIKSSPIHLHIFYHPETHEDSHTISLFEKIAEEIIPL